MHNGNTILHEVALSNLSIGQMEDLLATWGEDVCREMANIKNDDDLLAIDCTQDKEIKKLLMPYINLADGRTPPYYQFFKTVPTVSTVATNNHSRPEISKK